MFIVAREPGLGENGQGFMTVSLKDGVISLDICLAVQISLDVRLQILRTDADCPVDADNGDCSGLQQAIGKGEADVELRSDFFGIEQSIYGQVHVLIY